MPAYPQSCNWSPIPMGSVRGLVAFDDGTGPKAHGFGTPSNGGAASLVRLDGANWTSFGSLSGGLGGDGVGSMVSFNDGSGAALYVSGKFAFVAGVPANNVARWNGSSWSSLGAGLGNQQLIELPDDMRLGVAPDHAPGQRTTHHFREFQHSGAAR